MEIVIECCQYCDFYRDNSGYDRCDDYCAAPGNNINMGRSRHNYIRDYIHKDCILHHENIIVRKMNSKEEKKFQEEKAKELKEKQEKERIELENNIVNKVINSEK